MLLLFLFNYTSATTFLSNPWYVITVFASKLRIEFLRYPTYLFYKYLLGSTAVLESRMFSIIKIFKCWKKFFLPSFIKFYNFSVVQIQIQDLVPFWPLDPGSGIGKKSGSGSGKNNPDHISESIKTFFGVKILKFFDLDTGLEKFGSGIEKSRIREPG